MKRAYCGCARHKVDWLDYIHTWSTAMLLERVRKVSIHGSAYAKLNAEIARRSI